MATRVNVEYYTNPGVIPQMAIDTFNAHDGIGVRIHTTPAGVLEIKTVTGNGEILKAYAPGRWVDAKVLE